MMQVPLSVIRDSGMALSSYDLWWGWSKHLITPQAVIGVAVDAVANGCEDEGMMDLACLLDSDACQVPYMLEHSSASMMLEPSPGTDEMAQRKWLFLALESIYVTHEDKVGALPLVEDLWCDFGHPDSLAPLIRWMPAQDDIPVGLSGIVKKWGDFLTSEQKELRSTSGR